MLSEIDEWLYNRLAWSELFDPVEKPT